MLKCVGWSLSLDILPNFKSCVYNLAICERMRGESNGIEYHKNRTVSPDNPRNLTGSPEGEGRTMSAPMENLKDIAPCFRIFFLLCPEFQSLLQCLFRDAT